MEVQIVLNKRNIDTCLQIIEILQAENLDLKKRLGALEGAVALQGIDVQRLKVADAIVGR